MHLLYKNYYLRLKIKPSVQLFLFKLTTKFYTTFQKAALRIAATAPDFSSGLQRKACINAQKTK